MFKDACHQYWDLRCEIGGGSKDIAGKLFGKGCLLTPDVILTARHVFSSVARNYDWPVVLKHDGLFKCDVIYDSKDSDICIYHAAIKLRDVVEMDTPRSFPTLYSQKPFLGLQVGYFGTLRSEDEKGEERAMTSFSAAFISFMVPDSKPIRFGLNGGVIQRGFSGSPVFTAKGDLVGVIVQSMKYCTDYDQPLGSVHTFSIISPIMNYHDEIAKSMIT